MLRVSEGLEEHKFYSFEWDLSTGDTGASY